MDPFLVDLAWITQLCLFTMGLTILDIHLTQIYGLEIISYSVHNFTSKKILHD